MIPREILKNIRQLEIRTNRLVSETLTGVINTRAEVLNREIRQIEIHTNRLVSETLTGVINTRAGVLDREIRQIRKKGKGIWSLFRSRISRGLRLKIVFP